MRSRARRHLLGAVPAAASWLRLASYARRGGCHPERQPSRRSWFTAPFPQGNAAPTRVAVPSTTGGSLRPFGRTVPSAVGASSAVGRLLGCVPSRRLCPAGRIGHIRHTGTDRPASTTGPSQRCGELPLCGGLGVVNDAKLSAMRESSAVSGRSGDPRGVAAPGSNRGFPPLKMSDPPRTVGSTGRSSGVAPQVRSERG